MGWMMWGLIPIHISPGAHLASYSVGALGIKQLGHEINDLPPSSAGVKNKWWYTSASPACLHCMGGDKFTVPFNLQCKRSHLFIY